ncbi:porin [Paraburkholderia sp. ZP32-5]|uniref:porin n=1 Tax=Paraburkholderia sp. ZP32-5 TaxID=2883245 RepID=UPI00227967DE|nr:porin [Paraburkholderia sp. ZP32-5]
MKTTFKQCWPILLAATLPCAAHAQSSVTLYGTIDASIQYARTGGKTVARLDSNNVFPSDWGLTGAEDIGGGTKVIFKLENGFNVANGQIVQTGKIFGREAWVGLSGPYGRVQFGLNNSPEMWGLARFEAGDLGRWDWGHAANNFNFFVSTKISNSVIYVSPTFNGFTFSAMWGFGANGDPTLPRTLGNTASLGVYYAKGPLSFEADYESQVYSTDTVITPSSPTSTGNHSLFGIGYDFGFVHLYGLFVLHRGAAQVKVSNPAAFADPNNFYYDLSAQIPHVLNGTLIADFGQYKLQGNSNGNATSYGLRYDYRLSKRTGLYAGIAYMRNGSEASFTENPAQGAGIPVSPGKNLLTTVVGMVHSF